MMLTTLDDGLWECTDLVECSAAELRIPIGPWVKGMSSFPSSSGQLNDARTDSDDTAEEMLRQVGRIMQQLLRVCIVYS